MVRLESVVLQCEPSAGTPEPGLDLVDDEQRAVVPAKRLRGFEVTLGCKRHHAALDRLDDERSDISCAQLRFQPRQVAERNALAAGQQRAEPFFEELVTDQRERPERDPVEAVVAGEQPRPARRSARELHRRVHGLGAGAREEHGVEPARQTL
jgi:hypothetical protein